MRSLDRCFGFASNHSLSRPVTEYCHRLIVFTVLALSLLALTQHVAAQGPPLIDRELFFGDPEISGAQISPDGASSPS
jgi:hypothetical protein